MVNNSSVISELLESIKNIDFERETSDLSKAEKSNNTVIDVLLNCIRFYESPMFYYWHRKLYM